MFYDIVILSHFHGFPLRLQTSCLHSNVYSQIIERWLKCLLKSSLVFKYGIISVLCLFWSEIWVEFVQSRLFLFRLRSYGSLMRIVLLVFYYCVCRWWILWISVPCIWIERGFIQKTSVWIFDDKIGCQRARGAATARRGIDRAAADAGDDA